MDKRRFLSIMFTVIQTLSDRIKNHYNVSYEEALDMLYHSQLYRILEKEDTKMWYFSSTALLEMFDEEQRTGKITIYGG